MPPKKGRGRPKKNNTDNVKKQKEEKDDNGSGIDFYGTMGHRLCLILCGEAADRMYSLPSEPDKVNDTDHGHGDSERATHIGNLLDYNPEDKSVSDSGIRAKSIPFPYGFETVHNKQIYYEFTQVLVIFLTSDQSTTPNLERICGRLSRCNCEICSHIGKDSPYFLKIDNAIYSVPIEKSICVIDTGNLSTEIHSYCTQNMVHVIKYMYQYTQFLQSYFVDSELWRTALKDVISNIPKRIEPSSNDDDDNNTSKHGTKRKQLDTSVIVEPMNKQLEKLQEKLKKLKKDKDETVDLMSKINEDLANVYWETGDPVQSRYYSDQFKQYEQKKAKKMKLITTTTPAQTGLIEHSNNRRKNLIVSSSELERHYETILGWKIIDCKIENNKYPICKSEMVHVLASDFITKPEEDKSYWFVRIYYKSSQQEEEENVNDFSVNWDESTIHILDGSDQDGSLICVTISHKVRDAKIGGEKQKNTVIRIKFPVKNLCFCQNKIS